MPPRKLVYLATEDWYFCLHRLVVARAARDAGWEVIVATRVDGHGDRIRAEGFKLVPLPWRRRGGGLWREVFAFLIFLRMLRRERPQLVHGWALKAMVYGGLAARLARIPLRIGTVAGLGSIFSSSSLKARLMRPIAGVLLGLATSGRGSMVTLENADDGVVLDRIGAIPASRMVLIQGSGVDIHRFSPVSEPDGVPIIAMACRLLRGKGAGVTVAAARLLRARGVEFRFRLAGSVDPHSSESFSQEEVDAWIAEGIVDSLGWIEDVPGFWRACHVAVYPSSYGEGVPRSSLEAMACGKPLVTTDMPGCRDTVEDGQNGFLVPPNDPHAVADRIEMLLADRDLRARMGKASRQRAIADFSDERFIRDTLALYKQARPALPV